MKLNDLFKRNRKPRAYIIAEIGGNFTTYEQAVELVDAAKSIGVDCVKLQTYRAANLSTKNATFDMENTGKISQYEYFKKFEISEALHKRIFNYIKMKNLDCFSTPSHFDDVDMLESLGSPAYKIGADDAVNIPLLAYIAQKNKPIFLSTGMCTLDEIKESVSAILKTGNRKIAILHTVSAYPTYAKYVNLRAISTLKEAFPGFIVGFSDHTLTIIASMAAVSMGAQVIERHFTTNKHADGPDHMLSSTPGEMKELVDNIRTIELMMGTGAKKPFGPEIKNRINNRKSIVAIKKIEKGEKLTQENISLKRPGKGLPPELFRRILGKHAKRCIASDTFISKNDFS